MVKSAVQAVVHIGIVKRAQLGVAAQPLSLTQRIIGANHLTTRSGVYVYEISERPGIGNTLLEEGDRIVEF